MLAPEPAPWVADEEHAANLTQRVDGELHHDNRIVDPLLVGLGREAAVPVRRHRLGAPRWSPRTRRWRGARRYTAGDVADDHGDAREIDGLLRRRRRTCD